MTPVIWINPNDASKSIDFGTDKNTEGAIYAFNLDGKIIADKTIRGMKRPNNVDLEYGLQINDSTFVDVIAFTERERKMLRLYSVPDMKPLDNRGFPVFENETGIDANSTTRIALHESPKTKKIYAIIDRKNRPAEGYLHQFEIQYDSLGVNAKLVRKFGAFSGKKEIEAISVDNVAGIVYYSDEMHCIQKYYASPEKSNEELSCFGSEYFEEDIEGIAIAKYKD